MALVAANINTVWRDSWYPSTMLALTQLAGTGDDDESTGASMPNLSAIDTMALLGVVTPTVVSAINRYASQQKLAVPILRSDRIGPDGTYLYQPEYDGAGTAYPAETEMKSVSDYLAYQTDTGATGTTSAMSWKRYPTSGDAMFSDFGSYSFEPYAVDNDESRAFLQLIRQMISDWQRMVDSSASAITTNSADTTQRAPAHDLSEFLAALRALCADLDVLNENPPVMGSISEAIKYALAKSSEFVGKAAAEVASEVGKTAGIIGTNLAGGFLANAGIISVVVVAIVIHLYL